ncbi:MAG: hypothetical protein FJ023_08485 [Chloroflexi bacterium]|nr:hypothetical protein [Chloroflexota bacterium]
MSTTVQPTTTRPGDAKQQPNPPELSNGNGRRLSRLHMQKHLPDYGLVINCFADTPAELWFLYQEMLQLIDQNDQEALAKAHKAGSPRAIRSAKPAAIQPSRSNNGVTNKPVCQGCGTDEAMELIAWKDKTTGELKKAWKCQSCEKWAR